MGNATPCPRLKRNIAFHNILRVFFSSHGERAFGVLPEDVQKRIAEELTHLAQDSFLGIYFQDKSICRKGLYENCAPYVFRDNTSTE